MALFSLVGQEFSACAARERISGHYRQVFVDDTRMLATPIRLHNCVISACCGLSCFSHRVNGKNDRILSFCIVLRAIPNFHSVAQVSARRGRDWRLRTTLLCEPLNVIIGWVMHKAHNLLNMSQPPNDSMLATCSDNHYTLSAVPHRSMDDRSYVPACR